MTKLPLAGIRVVDLTKVLAGPLCTQNLADLGADVIKVEPIDSGDETRNWPPFQSGEGAVFLSINRNKKSLSIDLKTAEGQDILHRLAATCDIAIESFAPGVAARLGADYAQLKAANPKIIYCSISGYGQFGPLSSQPGYDLILQAFSGLLAMTGEEGGAPVRSPMSPIDQSTGLNALAGILAALVKRERTGEGSYLEVSLFETSLHLLGYILQSYWVSGKTPGKSGSGHPSLCPYQIFQASDGDILIGIPNDRLWRRFCSTIGRPELGLDPRFATNAARVEHSTDTIAVVADAVGQETIAATTQLLAASNIPCAPVNTLPDLLDHPHTKARGLILDYDDPTRGPSHAVALPILFAGAERSIGAPPPLLGQHSAAILAELGYSRDDIAALVERGRVASNDPTLITKESPA